MLQVVNSEDDVYVPQTNMKLELCFDCTKESDRTGKVQGRKHNDQTISKLEEGRDAI